MTDLRSLSSDVNSLIIEVNFFFGPLFVSHKSILNEISCVQSSIWETVASAYLARRITIANSEPFKQFCSISFSHSHSRVNLLKNHIYIYIYTYA